MNAAEIYQRNRDDAFADQFASKSYETFVAMPFTNRGGYPYLRIKAILDKVHERANQGLPAAQERKFRQLRTVSTTGAIVITDEIISQIMSSHFFFGDLTGCNFGVVLEAGLALALKPNRRVILMTQDDIQSLHFDLKVTNIPRYKESDLVKPLATELVTAAKHFEKETDRYVRFLSSRLTPDAIRLLNIYGRVWKDRKKPASIPSIWEGVAGRYDNRFKQETGKIAFHSAVRELGEARLFWTEYKPNTGCGADSYGIHATRLGWTVIEHLWAHDEKMRRPPSAPTGPNL